MIKKMNSANLARFLLFSLVFMIISNMCFAQGAESINLAFSNAKIKGTIGSYFEFTDADRVNSDFSWATGYLTIKYETRSWNRFKFGARFFAHTQLYSDSDNSAIDPFQTDIESPYTLPELYLNYGFSEESSMRVGRWNHQKISHIDDAQSEGAYLSIKEIPGLELIFGFMSRFAEIDYDDGEDFGRNNKSQDLDNDDVYGLGSQGYLMFIESRFKAGDFFKINPYLMYQDKYAAVYGIDAKIENKDEDSKISYGTMIDYYFVDADKSGSGDSSNFAFFPFIAIKSTEITLGYANFDNGSSLNKPVWLRDYFTLADQQKEYGVSGSEKYFAKVRFAISKFWMHVVYADNNYDFNSSRGDDAQELESQVGYNFSESVDLNIRLFDVRYDNVADKDYQRIEARARFKF